YVGDRTILDANVYPANATNTSLLWESSNTAVASVSAAGLVTLLGEGEAVITCTAKDGSGVSVTCPVTVSVRQETPKDIKVEMISIQKNNHEGYPGDELRLDVTVYPENATNPEIQWESSNPSVASVTNAGVVTLLSEG
ncbi:MAG: Ig-like domain-containing protein, partial [Paramuribaculum sp.]|nr:Ig-like domain-containing protein [Paramuribaculum sp.]